MPANEHTISTMKHKALVARYMGYIAQDLFKRAVEHDNSKFGDEEFDLYSATVPLLNTLEFGSPEYREATRALGPALQHHVTTNRHHAPFFPTGVNGMHLLDLIEMVCDWLAASRRGVGNNIYETLPGSCKHFKIGEQLGVIIANTLDLLIACEQEEQ